MADNVVDSSTITTLAELGDAWARLMEEAGLSQRRLAEKAATAVGGVSMSRPIISEIVNGRRLPTHDQQIRFLDLVGLTDADELER
ncbi:helix-turn-helix transcriptional regulator [Actinoplanes sp. NPDC051633]|uniref:helix-turn-helix transcriptional regulator n=1 Tax=Actinoplanes sp. NPDC051633 TaxID=3155670 RepID=UPI003418F3CA